MIFVLKEINNVKFGAWKDINKHTAKVNECSPSGVQGLVDIDLYLNNKLLNPDD